jgi:rhomboid protease GluP
VLLGAAALFALLVAAVGQFAPERSLAESILLSCAFAVPAAIWWAIPRVWPPPPIECMSDALLVPRFGLSRRQLHVPYERVFDVAETQARRGLMIGVRGRLPLRYAAESLVGEGAVRDLVACVRERIAALPDGAARIHALDERARLSAQGDARPWASWGFVVLLFGAFALQSAAGVAGGDPVRLARFGANAPMLVAQGEYFRLFTANLLHAGVGHLYMNGVLLMLLGPRLEAVLGSGRTALVLLLSGVGGAWFSSVSSQALLSLGASTSVFGVVAAFGYVNLTRRDELPADLRVPLWLGSVLVAAQLLSEFRLENVDHMAHVGGLAFGWIGAAIAVGRVPLARLREEPGSVPRLALALLAAAWIGALIQAGARIAAPDAELEARFTEEVLRHDAAAPAILRREAVRWALDSRISDERARIARASLERASQRSPTDPALWDALAVLRARGGSREGAIIAQWRAAVLEATAPRLVKLAFYERDRLAEDGILRMGLGSRLHAQVGFELEGPGNASLIDVRFSQPLLRGAVVHVLVFRQGQLVGHLELWLGPTRERWLRFESEDLRASGASDLDFRVALIDTRPRNLPPGSVQVRFWALTSGATAGVKAVR